MLLECQHFIILKMVNLVFGISFFISHFLELVCGWLIEINIKNSKHSVLQIDCKTQVLQNLTPLNLQFPDLDWQQIVSKLTYKCFNTHSSTSSSARQCWSRLVLSDPFLTALLRHCSNWNLPPLASSSSIGCLVVAFVILAKLENIIRSFPSGKSCC